MNFKAGQYITLGLPDDYESREYSIYSAENSPFLEVLIKEIDEGKVSKQLKRVKEGETVRLDGPFGFFTLERKFIENSKILLIASGTGISPFHIARHFRILCAGSHPAASSCRHTACARRRFRHRLRPG